MKAYTLIFVDNQKGVKTTWREDDVARFWLVDRAVNQSKGTIARGDLDLNYRLPMTIKKIKVKVSENIDTLSLTNNTKGYHLVPSSSEDPRFTIVVVFLLTPVYVDSASTVCQNRRTLFTNPSQISIFLTK